MNAITQHGTQITLEEIHEIHRGGEGKILLVSELPNTVAKIYFDEKNVISDSQIKALSVLDKDFFVKPTELIKDSITGKTLGFLMPYLNQDYIPLYTLFSEPFCRKYQISESRKLKIAADIQAAIKLAHKKHIIIGDLSGFNILVNRVNDDVKFIDVDSYGTQVKTHSGVLYDEIRDYYYNGVVSQESDWFAFGVLLFQLLTYLHPFKGVLPSFPTLRKRMIHQIPVFSNQHSITIPKCYQPITDSQLFNQFEAMFYKGLRKPIDLNGVASSNVNQRFKNTTPTTTLPNHALEIKNLYELLPGEIPVEWSNTTQKGALKTNLQWIIFDLSQRGFPKIVNKIPRNLADEVFATNRNIVVRKGENLGYLISNNQITFLTNVVLSKDTRLVYFPNLLAVVETNYLKLVHLDKINGEFVEVHQIPVFGQGIHIHNNSMWQIVGGKRFVFYHSGNTLSTVFCPFPIHSIMNNNNHGLISYFSNSDNHETTLNSTYFSIRQLQLNLNIKHGVVSGMKHFAYLPSTKEDGIIFEPDDNQLIIRRTEDFSIIETIDCPELSETDQLYYSHAGIVSLSTNGKLILLNKPVK